MDLERRLKNRRAEPASVGFEDRIIARAYPRPLNEPIMATINRIFSEFFPRPAYALVAILLAGCVLGFTFSPDASLAHEIYLEDGGLE